MGEVSGCREVASEAVTAVGKRERVAVAGEEVGSPIVAGGQEDSVGWERTSGSLEVFVRDGRQIGVHHHPGLPVPARLGDCGPGRQVESTAGRFPNDGDPLCVRPGCDSAVARDDGDPTTSCLCLGDDVSGYCFSDLAPLSGIEHRREAAFGDSEGLDRNRNQNVVGAHARDGIGINLEDEVLAFEN